VASLFSWIGRRGYSGKRLRLTNPGLLGLTAAGWKQQGKHFQPQMNAIKR
jgi:hypothetical protein